jgi:hypothetical protein
MAPRPRIDGMTYLYAYYVDGIVRYVGKGNGPRILAHRSSAEFLIKNWQGGGRHLGYEPFHRKLAKAILGGAEVESVIFAKDLFDEEAYAIEARLIAGYPAGQLWGGTRVAKQYRCAA